LILTFDALAMTSSFEFPFLKNILRLYYKMKLVHFHRCMFDCQLFVGTKKGLCLPASSST
jgi:thiosulfate reductase cytochrome b subunit